MAGGSEFAQVIQQMQQMQTQCTPDCQSLRMSISNVQCLRKPQFIRGRRTSLLGSIRMPPRYLLSSKEGELERFCVPFSRSHPIQLLCSALISQFSLSPHPCLSQLTPRLLEHSEGEREPQLLQKERNPSLYTPASPRAGGLMEDEEEDLSPCLKCFLYV